MSTKVGNYQIIPPDKGWSWGVCLASFMVQFLTDGTLYSFPTFEKDIANYLNVDVSLISQTNAIVSFFYLFGGPIASAVVNQWGCRVVGIIGGLLSMTGYLLCSFLTYHYMMLYIFQGFIGGIGLGFNYLCANVIIGLYFEKWRGLATGIGASGTGMSQIVIYPVIGAIKDKWGWRACFIVLSILEIITGFLALFYLPLEPVYVTSKTEITTKSRPVKGFHCKKKNNDKKNEKMEKNHILRYRKLMMKLFDPLLLSSPTFWLFLFTGFLLSGGAMGTLFIMQRRATEFGIKEKTARYLITVFGVCNMIGRILSGLLLRIPKFNLIKFSAVIMIFAAISFFSTSFPWAKNSTTQYINSCFLGFFLSPFCLRHLIAIDLFGLRHLPNSFGLQMVSMGLGVIVEMTTANYILERTKNDYRYPSAIIFSFFIVCSLGYFLFKPIRNWEIKRGILLDK